MGCLSKLKLGADWATWMSDSPLPSQSTAWRGAEEAGPRAPPLVTAAPGGLLGRRRLHAAAQPPSPPCRETACLLTAARRRRRCLGCCSRHRPWSWKARRCGGTASERRPTPLPMEKRGSELACPTPEMMKDIHFEGPYRLPEPPIFVRDFTISVSASNREEQFRQ